VDSGACHDIHIDSAVQILQSVAAVESAEDVKNLIAAQLEMKDALQRALEDGQGKLAAMRLEVCCGWPCTDACGTDQLSTWKRCMQAW
jgi:hypothetical protein